MATPRQPRRRVGRRPGRPRPPRPARAASDASGVAALLGERPRSRGVRRRRARREGAGTPLAFGPDADVGASARLIADRARTAEVVYLGELHDNPQHHAIQARILEAMLAAGARPALAFEMIPETRPGGARGGGPERRGARRGRSADRLERPGLARLRDVLAALRAGAASTGSPSWERIWTRRSPAGSAGAASRAAGADPGAAPLGPPGRSRARPGDRAAAPGGPLRPDQRGPREPGCSRAGTRATWSSRGG